MFKSIIRRALAPYLLAAAVASLAMTQASQLLGLTQSEGQSAYTMSALTRMPVPFDDKQVVAALEAWRAACLNPAGSGQAIDETLLRLVRSWIGWHVVLDLALFAPALAIILGWVLRRKLP